VISALEQKALSALWCAVYNTLKNRR